jgi:uncharacterized repeat protein (TIGR03806 family)
VKLASAASVAAAAALVVAFASCGSVAGDEACTPGGDGTYVRELYDELDSYCMVAIRDGEIAPLSAAVVPYELVTPLFSDYAVKRRTVWVPPGTAATYRPDDAFDFPVGTLVTKSFGFPAAEATVGGPVRWVETRVMVRREAGWTGTAYLWDEAQRTARKQPGGAIRDIDVRATDGSVRRAAYLVPSQQQCPKCHGRDSVFVPLGLRESGLARDDQLARWTRAGILEGAPAVGAPPRPAWNDPLASTEVRARAYLDANCAFCHDAKGEARTTGLYLTFGEAEPARLGRCKSPVAAGRATGGLRFDVVPGDPDTSILLQRMLATEPALAMPEIGRSLVHTEGVELVRAWIAAMSGGCADRVQEE